MQKWTSARSVEDVVAVLQKANVAVGIPTFNRPADCANALSELTADALVDEVIGAVIVPDQGVRKVRDHPDFPAAAARLRSEFR